MPHDETTQPFFSANHIKAKPWFEPNSDSSPHPNMDAIAHTLISNFNKSPFSNLCGIRYFYNSSGDQHEIYARVDNEPNLIGNVSFNILHGGVAATILDSVGGLVGIFELYARNQGTLVEQTQKAQRFATVDLRIDYLAPGRGEYFIATAEVIRMGRKGCTTRMLLVNDEGKPIAHGLASYAF